MRICFLCCFVFSYCEKWSLGCVVSVSRLRGCFLTYCLPTVHVLCIIFRCCFFRIFDLFWLPKRCSVSPVMLSTDSVLFHSARRCNVAVLQSNDGWKDRSFNFGRRHIGSDPVQNVQGIRKGPAKKTQKTRTKGTHHTLRFIFSACRAPTRCVCFVRCV